MPANFLVCTVNGEGPSLETTSPPDSGLCDIIFFDSMYKVVADLSEDNFKKNEEAFLNWPKVYSSVQFGVSFSVEEHTLAGMLLTSGVEGIMKDLYAAGIRHAAVINIHSESVNEKDFVSALRALKIMYKTLSQLISPEPSYCVLGVAIDHPSEYNLVGLMNTHFVPSLFISIAHISYDDRLQRECRMFPPTWLSIPQNFDLKHLQHGHTLIDSCNLLSEVAKAVVDVPVAISFSLSGRLYQPEFRDPDDVKPEDFRLFGPCELNDEDYHAVPAELCTNGGEYSNNVQNSTKSDVVYTFDSNEQRTLTFDNEITIRTKVCATRDTYRGVPFGLAIYDIEYDAAATTCEPFKLGGPYARAKFLRNMNQYLRSRTAADPFNKQRCLAVTA